MSFDINMLLAIWVWSWVFIWAVDLLKKTGMSWKWANATLAVTLAVVAVLFEQFVPNEIKQNIIITTTAIISLANTIYNFISQKS